MARQISDDELDHTLAQSFPASDPLPMSPGSDAIPKFAWRVDSTRTHYETLTDAVKAQVGLLRAGKPLEAFDTFFDKDVLMFSNDKLFASGAIEGRAKQEPFIAAATSIDGRITDVNVHEKNSVCVFRNRTTFTDTSDRGHQIDGLSWQRWNNGLVVEERFYDGARMQKLLAQSILTEPALLLL